MSDDLAKFWRASSFKACQRKKTKEGELNGPAKTLKPIEHVHNLAWGDKLEVKLEGDQPMQVWSWIVKFTKTIKRQNDQRLQKIWKWG
jgi:hypothetical protein